MSKSVSSGALQSGTADPVAEAASIMILLGLKEAGVPNVGYGKASATRASLLQQARSLLATASPVTLEERHRFLAVKAALEALEATERGDELLPFRDQFRGHVEAVRGGEGAEIFGGRRITNKPNVETAFLRAAMYVLWERAEGDDVARAQIVRDAVSLEIIGRKTDSDKKNTNAVKKRVANIKNRARDGAGNVAAEWEHIDIVTRLVDAAGYRRLHDFQ
ncbi:hypothetical protein [Roseicyclus marinus]|uniref:Uncharacterized protein n=1 Tax=Roseicyclus marinus TaxID=2161673 RepID=A0AA48HV29_9RHOB|nr:hypothetical protein MACH21_28130 [Roseicyclus marinus]